MATFTFKFEAVLRHRRLVEDERQRALAKLLRQQMIYQSNLRTMQGTISDDKHQMGGALVGQVDVNRIRQHAAHVAQVTGRAQQIAVKLLALHRQIEHARTQLQEATRQRKAIELLHDRHLSQWRQQMNKRETNELDEIATQAHGRNIRAIAG